MIRKLVCAVAALCLVATTAFAELEIKRTYGRDGSEQVLAIRFVTTGTDADDANDWITIESLCNAWTGKSVVYVAGAVVMNSEVDFTGSTSLVGITAGARVDVKGLSDPYISWNETFEPPNASPFTCTTLAGDNEVVVTAGTVPSRGDWVVIWSSDQVSGNVPPHLGIGHGQCPEEVHLVAFERSGTLYLGEPCVDTMTTNGVCRGAVIPMDKDIVIDNLTFNWAGTGDVDDFAAVLQFTACENVTITPSVRTTRESPGSFRFEYCANVQCRANFNGTQKLDGIYGVIVGPVNGFYMNGVHRDTRHVFTTSNGQSVNDTYAATVQVDPTNTLDIGAHTITAGQPCNVADSTTIPTGLADDTLYYVVNPGATTVQLAATPGGTPITITSTGSGVSLNHAARWGTPINCLIRGVATCGDKVDESTGAKTKRIMYDTHAEGFGIVFEFVCQLSGTQQLAGHSRSRATVFRNCTITGDASLTNRGVIVKADDNRIVGCTFVDLAEPIIVDQFNTGYPIPDSCAVEHCTFTNCNKSLEFQSGAGHRLMNCVFHNVGIVRGNTPFQTKTIVSFGKDAAGGSHVVAGNQFAKGSNDRVIDLWQHDSVDIKFVGNTCTGYGSGLLGIGRIMTVSVDTAGDAFTVTQQTKHGLIDNMRVRFNSPFPTSTPQIDGVTDYYVLDVDGSSFQVETSIGAGAIDLTVDNGDLSYEMYGVDGFESAYLTRNHADP